MRLFTEPYGDRRFTSGIYLKGFSSRRTITYADEECFTVVKSTLVNSSKRNIFCGERNNLQLCREITLQSSKKKLLLRQVTNTVSCWVVKRKCQVFRKQFGCVDNCESFLLYLIFHPQCIYMLHSHIFIHASPVYYDIMNSEQEHAAPSRLDSSVGRALHTHRRGHGFKSRTNV